MKISGTQKTRLGSVQAPGPCSRNELRRLLTLHRGKLNRFERPGAAIPDFGPPRGRSVPSYAVSGGQQFPFPCRTRWKVGETRHVSQKKMRGQVNCQLKIRRSSCCVPHGRVGVLSKESSDDSVNLGSVAFRGKVRHVCHALPMLSRTACPPGGVR